MEKDDNPVLSLATCLSRAFNSLDSTEIDVPEGCRVVWHGEYALILSEDESIEIRLNIPKNVTISPHIAEGQTKIKVHVERVENKGLGHEFEDRSSLFVSSGVNFTSYRSRRAGARRFRRKSLSHRF